MASIRYERSIRACANAYRTSMSASKDAAGDDWCKSTVQGHAIGTARLAALHCAEDRARRGLLAARDIDIVADHGATEAGAPETH